MAFNGAFLWVQATSADQTAYANTDRLKTISGTVYLSFPEKYMALKGYSIDPNKREEIKAYRDDNTRNLTRVTATGTKTTMKIKMLGALRNAQKKEVFKWFTDHESDALQRKISLLFYDSDTDGYRTGSFYRADTELTAISHTNNDIVWDSFDFELTQY